MTPRRTVPALVAGILLAAGPVGGSVGAAPPGAAGCTVVGSHTGTPSEVRLGDVVRVEVTVDVACSTQRLSRQFILALPAWRDPVDADKAREAAKAFVESAHALGLEVGLALGHRDPPQEVEPTAAPAAVHAALDAYGAVEGGSSVAPLIGASRALLFDATGSRRLHTVVVDHSAVPASNAVRLRVELETTLDEGIEITHVCVGGGCPALAGTEELAVGDLDALPVTLGEIAGRPARNVVEWVTARQSLGPLVDYVYPSATSPATRMATGSNDNFLEWDVLGPRDQFTIAFDVRPFAIGRVEAAGPLVLDGLDSSGGLLFNTAAEPLYVQVRAEPARPSACRLMGTAGALPTTLQLGQTLTATLTLATDCPARARDVDVVLAFDQSSSMEGLPREAIVAAAERFLDRVNLRRSRVAIVLFESNAHVRSGFTQDRATLTDAIRSMQFYGDTALAKAIDTSRALLEDRRAGAMPVIVMLSDGQVRDDPIPAAAWARAAGIRIAFVCYSPTVACDDEVFHVASSQYLFLARDEAELTQAYDTLGSYLALPDIDRLSVVHTESDGLLYSSTPAMPNPPSRSELGELVWSRADPLLGQTVLRYPLTAQGIGEWPLARSAIAYWVDSDGGVGIVDVPVPKVMVRPPDVEGPCRPIASRSAAPGSVGVGDVVTVTSHIDVACDPSAAQVDVVFAVDHSFSMGTLGRLDSAVAAVEAFLEQTGAADVWQGLAAFNDTITDRVALTGDPEEVMGVLRRLRPNGGTDIGRAVAASLDTVLAGREGARKMIVVVTDGDNAPTGRPILDAAGPVHEAGVLLVTVCAGGSCAPELAQAASGPEYFFNVVDAADLTGVFARLAQLAIDAEPTLYLVEELIAPSYTFLDSAPSPSIGGPTLWWDFRAPPPEGVELIHRLVAQRSGVGSVAMSSQVRYTLLGGKSGSFFLPHAQVEVRDERPALPTAAPVPSPTPFGTPGPDPLGRAWLPRVAVP